MLLDQKSPGRVPIAVIIDPGSDSQKMMVLYANGATEQIHGKGPDGVFKSHIHHADGKFNFDADAQSLNAQNPLQGAWAWKAHQGTGKKFINDQFTSEELEAHFKAYQRQVAEKQLGVRLEGLPVFMSRSHSVSDVGAAATGRAVEKAGWKMANLISEQAAVIYGYLYRNNQASGQKDRTVGVADQGGYSFDACVAVAGGDRIDIKGTRSIPHVAGMEMTRRLMDLALGKAAKLFGVRQIDVSKFDPDTLFQFREGVERAKINLSTNQSIQISVPYPDTIKVKSVQVTQEEYNTQILDPLFKPMRECLEQTLADAKMAAKDIEFVIASGAPMANRYLCDLVSKFFGRPLETDIKPAWAVVLGVAAFGFDELKRQGKTNGLSMPEIILTDRLPALVGVMMQMEGSEGLFAVPLFEKETPVPSETMIRGRLTHKGQDSIDIQIAQAPCAFAKLADVKVIGRGRLTNLPREQVMTDRFEFRGKLRSGGLTDVLVVDTLSQQSVFITAQLQN